VQASRAASVRDVEGLLLPLPQLLLRLPPVPVRLDLALVQLPLPDHLQVPHRSDAQSLHRNLR
jgi:hypothetical protein